MSVQYWSFAYPYPYEVAYFTFSDGGKIAYRQVGEGRKTILLIHGLGSYQRAWDPLLPFLQNEYRCLVVDLPFSGRSEGIWSGISLSFFTKRLVELLDGLGLERVHVLGHSMGGHLGLQLALSHPRRVDRLFLLAPAGFEQFSADEVRRLQEIFQPELLARQDEESILANFRRCFYRFPESAQFMVDDRLLLRQNKEQYRLFLAIYCECLRAMLAEPVFADLQRVEAPTAILFGLDDLFIPNQLVHADWSLPALVVEAAKQLSHSELLFLSACGHFPHWDRLNDCQKAILRFFEE